MMTRLFTFVALMASFAFTTAFVQPMPARAPVARGSRTTSVVRMAVDPDHLITATTSLIAGVYNDDVFVDKIGQYPWGAVQAPAWVLPVGALSVVGLGALIPLFLKDGVDAFNAAANDVEFQPAPTPKKGTRNRNIINKGQLKN